MRNNNKIKSTSAIVSSLMMGLILFTMTISPNVNAISNVSGIVHDTSVTDNSPRSLSQDQLIQAENAMLNDDAVKKLINGKSYTMGSNGFIGDIKHLGKWNPVLKLIVDKKLQYAVGVNLTTNRVLKIVEGPSIGDTFSISNSNAHDTYRDGNYNPTGIQMHTTEPSYSRNPNYNYTGFMVNALEASASISNICTPSQGANNYWMQTGFDFNTQSSPSVFWTDTFYSCIGQPTLISYTTGQTYNFTITTDQAHSQWTTTITDGSGNVYTVSDTGMNKYTIEVVGSINHTGVWFENPNTKTTSPSWDSQFGHNLQATAKIKTPSTGWMNWGVEAQGEFQSCSTNQTPAVISGSLDSGSTATWSLSTMRANYPAC